VSRTSAAPRLIVLRPCQHDIRYIDGRSQIKVHTDEWTQVHIAQSSLVVTHPSTNRTRRFLTSVTESPSKHWSPLQTLSCIDTKYAPKNHILNGFAESDWKSHVIYPIIHRDNRTMSNIALNKYSKAVLLILIINILLANCFGSTSFSCLFEDFGTKFISLKLCASSFILCSLFC